MRTFGIIVVSLGIAACLLAGFVGLTAMSGVADMTGQNPGLGAIALSIAAIGIVGAGAIILRNSGPK